MSMTVRRATRKQGPCFSGVVPSEGVTLAAPDDQIWRTTSPHRVRWRHRHFRSLRPRCCHFMPSRRVTRLRCILHDQLPSAAVSGAVSPCQWPHSGHTTPRKTGRQRKITNDILAGQTEGAQVARRRGTLYGSSPQRSDRQLRRVAVHHPRPLPFTGVRSCALTCAAVTCERAHTGEGQALNPRVRLTWSWWHRRLTTTSDHNAVRPRPTWADRGRGGCPGQRWFPTRGSYLTSEGSGAAVRATPLPQAVRVGYHRHATSFNDLHRPP